MYSLPKFTEKHGLAHTSRLLGRLGEPCYNKKVIHVAGSNGKGSVCAFLYHMLLTDGRSVGMFTSPHLVDIRERFQVNGELVGEEAFLAAYGRVSAAVSEMMEAGEPHPTFFEFVYAMALVIFEEADVEFVILETGLGGRLDATNSFPSPILSIITSISLEHTEILGDTIGQIAAEKAGIIKPGVPVVCLGADEETSGGAAVRAAWDETNGPDGTDGAAAHAAQSGTSGTDGTEGIVAAAARDAAAAAADRAAAARVIAARAAGIGSPLTMVCGENPGISEIKGNSIDFSYVSDYDSISCDFKGSWRINGHALYQVENAALAIEAMRTLGIMDDSTIQRGLDAAVWPGRMQEVCPGIFFDGAHNPAGMRVFAESARRLAGGDAHPPILLFSMVKEKDIEEAARILTEGMAWDEIVVTAIPEERGAAPRRLAEAFLKGGSPIDTTAIHADAAAGRSASPNISVIPDIAAAFAAAREKRKPDQKLFAVGSLHFIGDLMQLLGPAPETSFPAHLEQENRAEIVGTAPK